MAHYISSERNGDTPVTVREFVSGFRGLSSTAKQRVVTSGFQREYLAELVSDDGRDLDHSAPETLLGRMQDASRPPKPASLGVIGKEHISRWMVQYAGASEDSVI